MAGGGGIVEPLRRPDMGTGKKKWHNLFIVAFIAFGGFLFGYDTGYISGVKAMRYWLSKFGQAKGDGTYILPTSDDSLVTSILSVGTCIGALAAYPVGDYLGRRMGLVVASGIFCIGVAMQTASTDVPLFAAGRVFAGLGVGLVSCIVPLYQSECAPKEIRGAVVSGYQWAITWGLLVAACVVQGTKDMDNAKSYRIPIALQFIWAAILTGGALVLPESPRWFLLKGRPDEARHSLSRLLVEPIESPVVEAEMADINAALQHERQVGSVSWFDVFSSKDKKLQKTLVGCALQALQQLTGINFIIYFGTQFFTSAGVDNPFVATTIVNVINVTMTVPGMIGVELAGRRPLLLYGAAGMFVSEFIVGICGETIDDSNKSGQKVLVAFCCLFIAHFAATWGPLAWVVTGEMFPLSMRAKGMALTTFSNWILNFAIGYSTPYIVDPDHGNLGTKVFFVWGSCCAACFVFTWLYIPEMKGLSLEQVELLWANSNAWNSAKYRREILAEGFSAPAAIGHEGYDLDKTQSRMDDNKHDEKHDEEKA